MATTYLSLHDVFSVKKVENKQNGLTELQVLTEDGHRHTIYLFGVNDSVPQIEEA